VAGSRAFFSAVTPCCRPPRSEDKSQSAGQEVGCGAVLSIVSLGTVNRIREVRLGRQIPSFYG